MRVIVFLLAMLVSVMSFGGNVDINSYAAKYGKEISEIESGSIAEIEAYARLQAANIQTCLQQQDFVGLDVHSNRTESRLDILNESDFTSPLYMFIYELQIPDAGNGATDIQNEAGEITAQELKLYELPVMYINGYNNIIWTFAE